MKTTTSLAAWLVVSAVTLGACGPAEPNTVAAGGGPSVTATTPVAPAPTTKESEEPAPADDCTLSSEEKSEGRPLITVSQPCSGQVVSSPVTIVGEANVFEATVSFRVLDENGMEIATGFTSAECGTGCWGAYSGKVKFNVDHEQPGTIEVFESSAKDGSDIHKVSVPVTLVP